MSGLQSFATLSVPADGRYVLCQVTRLPGLTEYREMLTEIVAVAKQHNLRRVLFDARAVDTPFSVLDGLAFGEALVAIVPGQFRMATIVSDIVPNRRFLETVAVNRGKFLCYFTDDKQAQSWLLGNS